MKDYLKRYRIKKRKIIKYSNYLKTSMDFLVMMISNTKKIIEEQACKVPLHASRPKKRNQFSNSLIRFFFNKTMPFLVLCLLIN